MTESSSFSVQATGIVHLTLTKPDGHIIKHVVRNKIVITGLNFIASRMVGTTRLPMSHMGLGTSSTTPDISQIDLQAPIGNRSSVVATLNNNTITYNATFPSGAGSISSAILQEAGIFNASTGSSDGSGSDPVMLCRATFPSINKTINDSLAISWIFTVSVPSA